MDTTSDAFFSHCGTDKKVVKQIAEILEKRGLTVWLDEWELQPGKPWQEDIEKALKSTKATVVFIGSDGLGAWETPEMRAALELQVERRMPVIPVLLPGATRDIELPLFLRRNTWVEFKDGIDDEKTIDKLCWGITGVKPAKTRRRRRTSGMDESLATDPINEALEKLFILLKRKPVTYFLGNSFSSQNDTGLLAADWEISRDLLKELHQIESGYDQMLPPLDVSASYYALKNSDPILEDRIADWIAKRACGVPPIMQLLVDLLAFFAKSPIKRRVRFQAQQLIITTNLDVMMERALLRSGIAFKRIVQDRDCNTLHINDYCSVSILSDGMILLQDEKRKQWQIASNDLDALDDAIFEVGYKPIHWITGTRTL